MHKYKVVETTFDSVVLESNNIVECLIECGNLNFESPHLTHQVVAKNGESLTSCAAIEMCARNTEYEIANEKLWCVIDKEAKAIEDAQGLQASLDYLKKGLPSIPEKLVRIAMLKRRLRLQNPLEGLEALNKKNEDIKRLQETTKNQVRSLWLEYKALADAIEEKEGLKKAHSFIIEHAPASVHKLLYLDYCYEKGVE